MDKRSPFPHFASRLRQARSAYRFSLARLAREAGISKTYLWELETGKDRGKSPSAAVVLRLSRTLGLGMEELLGLTPNGSRCEICSGSGEVSRYRVSGPPGVEFEKLLCFGCSTRGTINGWVVTVVDGTNND